MRFGWLVGVAVGMTGCAAPGGTLGSGVGDSFPNRAPYYAGATTNEVASRSLDVGHLPVVYQRGASHPALFDPALTPPMQGLLEDLTRELDSLGLSHRLVEGGRVSAVSGSIMAGMPNVSFGCMTPSGQPEDDCAERGDSALGRGDQRMKLAVTRASNAWSTWLGERLAESGRDAALIVTVEVGQYLLRQRGLIGNKEVELGTGHVARVPWLTSLETPVSVVQLTGALIGADGKAIRIGAEGLMAQRTSLPVSSLGAQRVISEADIEALRSARREDLPGTPLTWRVGLRTLVGELLGKGPLAP